jgi:hypothetical protein
MKPARLILICHILPLLLFSQDLVPPAVKGDFSKVTSYEELSAFVQQLDDQSDLLNVEICGQSEQDRNIYALKFSASEFGTDPTKIRALIFAQQHGNEQSGKEGSLMLAYELLKEENRYLFDKIDLALIPQVNPDGSEVNERFNANGMDLNRNHLILTERETQAIHWIFDQYLFEVTMDVHEYSPYSEEWKSYGYRKNSEITLGTTTNPNISRKIRQLSGKEFLPFIFKYLTDRGFTSFEYCPGGPPEINYIRHSTFDINDGRQSLGIQNTFSFIQEGMNGADSYVENLERRAEGQLAGMRGMLEYVFLNAEKIKNLVTKERKKLIAGNSGRTISIQSEHTANGQKLELPLFSYFSGNDTMVTVNDYRPVVKSTYNVKIPAGYLVPKELAPWVNRHSFIHSVFPGMENLRIEQYFINGIDSIDFEGDMTVYPSVTIMEPKDNIVFDDYIYLPAAQLNGKKIILALEPKSVLGLVTYKYYDNLLKFGEAYPVLRVVKKHR